MRKSLLLAGLVAFGFAAYAQDVVVEDPEWHTGGTLVAQPIPGDLDFTKSAYAYWGTSENKNIMNDGNVTNPAKYANPETWLFENTHGTPGHEDYADFLVTSDKASYYVITADTGTKISTGVFMTLQIWNGDAAEGAPVWEQKVTVPNNAEWNAPNKDGHPYGLVDVEIPAGNHLFRFTFGADENEDNPNYNTFNVHKINFKDYAVAPKEVSIYGFVFEGEDENEEAGALTINPTQEKYLTGSSVTFTATAKVGYKYQYMLIGDEQITSANHTMTVGEEDIMVFAYFEEINMVNAVPGMINLDTNFGVANFGGNATKPLLKEAAVKFYNSETGAYDIDATITYMQEIRATNSAGKVSFTLDVKEAKAYPLSSYIAMKTDGYTGNQNECTISFTFKNNAAPAEEPGFEVGPFEIEGTGQWTNFHLVNFGDVTFPEAGEYTMTINFIHSGHADGDKKETCNWYGICLGDRDASVNTIGAAEAPVKAYNMLGIEVAPDAEGLVIINGKKVINRK